MENNSEVVYLYLDDIIPNRFQPREVFDDQALKELAVSIKEHGVIQPIIVRQVENKYEIIAGERRYKASTMAGLTKIPAIVKNLDDKESSKVALIENLQRKDLSPIEEARTYQKILELEGGMTQEELAATMGKTQSSVSNKLRLLALPDEVQDALLKEKISERHARSLLNLEDKNDQIKMLDKIIAEKMTVRELDKEIKEMKDNKEENIAGGDNMNTSITENSFNQVNNTMTNTNENVSNESSPSYTPPVQQETGNLLTASDIAQENTNVPPALNNLIAKIQSNNEETNKPKFNLASFGDLSDSGENKTESVNPVTTTEAPISTEPSSQVPQEAPVQVNDNPTTVDINKIRENSVDIAGNISEALGRKLEPTVPSTQPQQKTEEFKFVPSFNFKSNLDNKQDELKEAPTNQFSKYFNPNTNNSNTSFGPTSNAASSITQPGLTIPVVKKDVTKAVSDIKTTVTNLENSGYKVKVEETDGENEYKITISLQKNA